MKHLIFLALSMQASIAWAGGAATLGKAVSANQQVSFEQVDHSSWDALLRKYCDSAGFVNYQAWQRSPQDQAMLDQYLAHLSQADPNKSSSRESQFAFWINAYNAVTIKGILREYPTTSIRNHTAKVFGYNIWDDLLLPVEGRTYSLNQMEHDVLRKMGDPRIHFAIVCASIGCPPLLNSAYTAEKIDSQLTFNSKRFFADRSKFSYDAAKRRIAISPILKWFAEDFGSDQATQMRRVAPLLPDRGAQTLASSGRVSVSYLDYDWGLNDQARRK
ncbi:MAG: DUF547 domain-containing protein [Planctomycetes bacterium]|nr:DUF547 domain-containing protein [Planctomycetota bacterium]